MIALVGLLVTTVGNVFPSLFGWLNKKTDANLTGFQTAAGTDEAAYKAYLDAQAQANAAKVNQWLGFKILASFAIEISLIYYGSIVWVSIVHPHVEGTVDQLPAQWNTAALVFIQSVIVITPTVPLWNAVSAWLNRK
jgi:hypothetical protein